MKLNEIIKTVNDKSPQLIIIRGLPGQGKSTLAKVLSEYQHFEADMFFIENDKYVFIPEKIRNAHHWCFENVKNNIQNNQKVVVSNTFTQLWEMEKYIQLTDSLLIIKCCGKFKNIHNVPETVLEKMESRWENYNMEIQYNP
jgi:adenylate kinase